MCCGEKLAASGEIENDEVGVVPCPVNATSEVAPVMFAVRVPELAPRAVGRKVTGTEIDCPDDRNAGKPELGEPIV
jgi:hypothetical protein